MDAVAIFDLDGTLINSAPAITRALNALRDAHGLPALKAAQVRRWVSLGAAPLVGRALGCDGDAPANRITEFRAHYAHQTSSRDDLYPGIADALDALRRAGMALGVCTNKPQAASERVLAQTGIAHCFDVVIGGDATPSPKPDGAHLRHTLAAMGCTGHPFCFIGDSTLDAQAAHASGARFLWASWGYDTAVTLRAEDLRLDSPHALVAAILQDGGT